MLISNDNSWCKYTDNFEIITIFAKNLNVFMTKIR